MRVHVYTYDSAGNETDEGVCDLTDALPEPDDEQALAYQALRDTGRFWGGGGAAVLFCLRRAD